MIYSNEYDENIFILLIVLYMLTAYFGHKIKLENTFIILLLNCNVILLTDHIKSMILIKLIS